MKIDFPSRTFACSTIPEVNP